MLVIEFPGIPPSVNSCYVNGTFKQKHGVRFKSQRYKDWEKIVESSMKRIQIVPEFFGPLSIEIEIYRPDWWTVKGSPKKTDISNRIKTLEDCVFKHLGIDDSWVWDIRASKMDSNEFKTVIRIFSLNEN